MLFDSDILAYFGLPCLLFPASVATPLPSSISEAMLEESETEHFHPMLPFFAWEVVYTSSQFVAGSYKTSARNHHHMNGEGVWFQWEIYP